METMDSIASMGGGEVGVLRRRALYICWGEGYSQFSDGEELVVVDCGRDLGIEEVVREVGRELGWLGARDWEREVGM
jgi:hypothetical protein